jgi:hypothetical protein
VFGHHDPLFALESSGHEIVSLKLHFPNFRCFGKPFKCSMVPVSVHASGGESNIDELMNRKLIWLTWILKWLVFMMLQEKLIGISKAWSLFVHAFIRLNFQSSVIVSAII